ncbi:hypothetical protein Tco_0742894 [Tanacetum coccineum]
MDDQFQVNPKVSHLHAVKRIFRYLKGQPKLGLWYLKDSPFDLVAYTDSDYAGASLDRKSTTGGCQFLGCRLISWQCKKQTVVANSTTEAEYVVASSIKLMLLEKVNAVSPSGWGRKRDHHESTIRRDLQLEDDEEADRLLAERLQAREQEELTDIKREKARLTTSSKKAEAEMAQESSSKRAGDELEQEPSKKQKMEDDKEIAELQSMMEVIPDEEEVAVDAIPLATKPPSIVDWKIIKEGKIGYYQIIRVDGNLSVIRNRRRNRGEPSLLIDFEEINMNNNNHQGPPPAGPIPQNPAPDLRTMEELLQAPTEGVGDAIVVPAVIANQFELKVELLNLVTSIPFHGFANDDPHSHIQRSTEEVSSSRISPLHQIDTFYKGLNQSDQDSLNSTAGGNLLTRNTQETLTIIENKSKVRTSRNKLQVSSSIGSSSQNDAIAALTKQVEALAAGGFTQGDGALPSNTVPNPREDVKGITTLSGITLVGPSVPLPSLSYYKEVERDPKPTMDQVHISSSKSTARVPSSVVQPAPVFKPNEIPKRNPHQPHIPYPSRLNKEKLKNKSDIQIHKFLQMFKKFHFNISLTEALALIPKYAKMLKDLLSNKEKLLELANTPLNENFSAVLLKKLPEKLGELGNEKCMALADLGKFTFPVNFVVVDYDFDPCVPLILGRPFLWTARALVDVHGENLILRVEYNSGSTTSYSDSSLLDYESFYFDDDLKEFEDLLYYDPLINPPLIAERSDSHHKEFAGELAHIISPPEYDHFYFDIEADPGELTRLLNENISSKSVNLNKIMQDN